MRILYYIFMTCLHSTSFFFLSNENEALKAPDRYYIDTSSSMYKIDIFSLQHY